MYQIDKQFDFCYGHRVWTQKLDSTFSLDNECACRRIHGHQGTIKIGLTADYLTAGMVTDFKHLNFFKKILDEHFDHKFICDVNDPLFRDIFSQIDDCELTGAIKDKEFYKIIDPNLLPYDFSSELKEKYEGLVMVDFVPTSENLSKMFFEIVDSKIKSLGVNVAYVDFWETPKSHCRYTKD